jgi:putative membrane protein
MTAPLPTPLRSLQRADTKKAVAAIGAVSACVFLALVGVVYGHGRGATPDWVAHLPAFNAFFNGASAVALVLAYAAVRRRQFVAHSRFMLTALGASAMFLVSYVVYHSVHGDTPFHGTGPVRPIYFFILITHIVLSAVALPLVFTSFFFALAGRFGSHKRVVRYAFPIWLYVSVTGVLVFFLLRNFG